MSEDSVTGRLTSTPIGCEVLAAAQGLAQQYLAPRCELLRWYEQIGLPSAERRMYGAAEDPTLDYDPRRYYDSSLGVESGSDPITENLYQVREAYRIALVDMSFNIARKYMLPLRAIDALCTALNAYGLQLDGKGQAGCRTDSIANHCEEWLGEVIGIPTIRLRRDRNGGVTVFIPQAAQVPEDLASRVNQLRRGDLPFLNIPLESSVRQRDLYHHQCVLLGVTRKQVAEHFSVTSDSVGKGLKDYRRVWTKSCGGKDLPILRRVVGQGCAIQRRKTPR